MASKERILVVDDERIILELTSMILRSRGYEVLTAESGRDGLQIVAEQQPALVLLDYMMPVMDGLTASSRFVRTTPKPMSSCSPARGARRLRSS